MALHWQRIESMNRPSPTAPQLGEWMATDRAQVPGGWLVRSYAVRREAISIPGAAIEPELGFGLALTFVPDPTGAWHA
jgi:hypothetical protein